MPFVYLALVAALLTAASCAPSPGGQNAPARQPAPPGEKPTIKEVRIVVAPLASLQEQCKAGTFDNVDILIDADPTKNEPYHCPGRNLVLHGTAHRDESTIVRVSYKNQDSVRWYSDTTEFAIVSIALHEEKESRPAPANPFAKMQLSPTPSKSIESGPIVQEAINHRYKIQLKIGDRLIDPDVWCQP